MRKPKILVVGSMVMDQIFTTPRFPDPGETVLGSEYRTAAGGKGANQAVAIAKLGGNVKLIGKVGNDAHGQFLLSALSSSGVDIECVSVKIRSSDTLIDAFSIEKCINSGGKTH